MREQDRILQMYYRYEEANGLDMELIVEYMNKKHECILDILRLLKELGMPFYEL